MDSKSLFWFIGNINENKLFNKCNQKKKKTPKSFEEFKKPVNKLEAFSDKKCHFITVRSQPFFPLIIHKTNIKCNKFYIFIFHSLLVSFVWTTFALLMTWCSYLPVRWTFPFSFPKINVKCKRRYIEVTCRYTVMYQQEFIVLNRNKNE